VLLVQYYRPSHPDTRADVNSALVKNLVNPLIDQVRRFESALQ
jgi:hypothetical protein